MRRAVVVGVLSLALPGTAQAASLTLGASQAVVSYDGTVTLSGSLAPAQPNVPVGIYADRGSWQLVASTATAADGSYRVELRPGRPGSFMAVAQLDATNQASSPPVAVRIQPGLSARVTGRRRVGERIVLTGRLLPADAGRLTLSYRGRTTRVRVGSVGRFRVHLRSEVPGRTRWRLRLAPAAGFEPVSRRHTLVLRAPALRLGSAGPAVQALERRLRDLHFVMPRVDTNYGWDTYAAVLAFQKVHGLARTGRVTGGVWSLLGRAGIPRAFVPSGTHIEISKTKQVLYEVVDGRVARAVHVSTGATGNTPVGSWRVYRLGPGYNALGMYYSLYFLRGFAIHGYRSVPSFPASHGCVRTPLWFARGFYDRWARIGTRVIVFP